MLFSPSCLAWTYTSTVAVDRTKCGTANLTNFPVLISVNNQYLKTVSNGGLVTSASGYDIVVATDSTIGTYVPWEVEYWTGTDGLWVGWALLTAVNGSSAGSNTTFGIAIGNSSITTQQNTGSHASTNVWDSYYKGVWHLSNGSTLNVHDSTSNGNNGTNSGGAAQSSCQIDGCLNLAANGDYVSVGTSGFPSGTGQVLTISAWSNTQLQGGAHCIFAIGNAGVTNANAGIYQISGAMEAGGAGTSQTSGVIAGTWGYVVLTYDGSTQRIYGNGSLANSSAQAYNLSTLYNQIGNDGYGEDSKGFIDEVRISNGIARSASWILSEYNNQSNPGNLCAPGFLIFSACTVSSTIRHQVSEN